jgi:hypothetical protein
MSKFEIDATYHNYSTWLKKYVRLLPMIDFANTHEELFGIEYNYYGWPIDHNQKGVWVRMGEEIWIFPWNDSEFSLNPKDTEDLIYMAARWGFGVNWLRKIIKANSPWQ